MRRIAVLAAVLLAFAAGWFGRGCAGESVPAIDATTETARPAEPQPRPVRVERTTQRPRAIEEPVARRTRTDDAPAKPPSDADSPPVPPGTPVVPVADPDAAKPLHDVEGIVVDSATRAPIEGVRIHFCATCDGEDLGWEGDTTDAAGKFRDHVLPDWPVGKCRFEVVAGRDGYRPARVPVATGFVRVELEKLDRAPRPGRVVGTARAEDGKPIAGRILVGMNDELDLHSFGVWTHADANGRFAIEGVAPGHWTIALSESRESFEVNVAEDGDASVDLRGKFEEATGAFAAGELTEAAYAREKTRLEHLMYGGLGSKDDATAGSAAYAGQQLEYQWLRYAPGRDVAVTGLPSAGGAFVRLDRREGACCEWRASVAGGKASFPDVPLGKWRAVLFRPGEPEIGVEVDVVKGDGALTVELPAAK